MTMSDKLELPYTSATLHEIQRFAVISTAVPHLSESPRRNENVSESRRLRHRRANSVRQDDPGEHHRIPAVLQRPQARPFVRGHRRISTGKILEGGRKDVQEGTRESGLRLEKELGNNLPLVQPSCLRSTRATLTKRESL